MLRFVCLGLGLILGLFNAFFTLVLASSRLARRDCAGIHALGDAAGWHHFFRKIGLVVVMLVAMTCAIAEKQTEACRTPAVLILTLLACGRPFLRRHHGRARIAAHVAARAGRGGDRSAAVVVERGASVRRALSFTVK